MSQIGLRLAWLGVDDAARRNAKAQHQVDLGPGRTIETGAQFGQQAEHFLVGVALDRLETISLCPRIDGHVTLTIEWLDAAQIHLPTKMLPVDFS